MKLVYCSSLVAFSLAGLLLAAPAADNKIDRGLINVLADDSDAKAPFFIVFSERADVKPAYRISNRAARGNFVVQTLQATANRSQGGVQGYLRGQKVAFTAFWVENKIYVPQGTLELARALAERPEVAAIIPEIIYTIPQPQSTGGSIQAIEWNISKIRAPQVWSGASPTSTGTGIVVANIDTGVQYTHPAVAGKYRGLNTDGSFTHTGNWKDPGGLCGATPCDNNSHGTHTMGTMVGDDGAGNQIGVAPGAKWIACKGCATNSCSSSDLTACAQWVLDPLGNNSGSNQPDVVNNSWGGGGGSSWYQSYVQNWRAAGIFPAFSNGNSGPSCSTAGSPGDYPESFASGATDSGDVIASFSSRGPSLFGGILKPDVSAPGVSVRSSVPTNSYSWFSGTSMASPHTAGAVALLWAAVPGYRGVIANTETVLRNSAAKLVSATESCGGIPTGVSPNNTYGNGRLDIRAAVDLAAGSQPNQPPTVTISSPATGSTFNCGDLVTFVASASDPENGSLTTSITWKDNGVSFGGSGSPVTKTFSCSSETGNRNIVASVTDQAQASDTDTITINIVDPNIPAAPSNLDGTVSGKTVNLTWKDNSNNEEGFRVERKGNGKNGSWTFIANTTANVVTFSNTGVPSGQWQYRVFAFKGSTFSAPSNTTTERVR